VGATTIDYLYDLDGRVMAEVNSGPTVVADYVYAGGQLIAEYKNSTTFFVHDNNIGTSTILTNLAGSPNPSDCNALYPFGEQDNSICSSSATTTHKFTGKERDPESNLDNFGARYDSSAQGRFMSPDPLSATLLHVINPQHWNLYAYVVNSPLTYIDPDGRHAIAVNFTKEVPGGGHEGIISLHSNGTATYARFGPKTPKSSAGPGAVQSFTMVTKVQFGKDGLPSQDSYKALAEEAAGFEKQAPNTVRMNFIETSEADTALLDSWIHRLQEASDSGNAPWYSVTSQNCATFCIAGLMQSNALQNQKISLIPNKLFDLLSQIATQNYPPPQKEEKKLQPEVNFRICPAAGCK
jgi:RHS repeat-associated protein